jgi:hypothetical protein
MTIVERSAFEVLQLLKTAITFNDVNISHQLCGGRLLDGELCFVTGKKCDIFQALSDMYTGVNTDTDEMFVIQYRMPQVKQNAAKGTLSTVVRLSQLIQELNQACMQEARVVLLMTGSSALDKFSIPEFETIVRVQLERGAVVITNWPNLSHLATQCITVSKP